MIRVLPLAVPILISLGFIFVPSLISQEDHGEAGSRPHILTSSKWYGASPIGSPIKLGPATQADIEPMPSVAPIFVEDAETSSLLTVVNSTGVKAGATITLRSLTGAVLVSVRRIIAPHEEQEITLQSLLTGADSSETLGSITVLQDADLRGMAIASQLLLTRVRTGLPAYLDEELAMPSMHGSSILRGVSDETAGSALLAITSIVNWELHVTLRCLGEKSELSPVAITIAPYATALVSDCTGRIVSNLENSIRSIIQHPSGELHGYELSSDGGPGSIAAFGLAPHIRNGDVVFSFIQFADPAENRSPNSVFAGLPVGSQDALPNGDYEPRMSFTNFAATPAHVEISIAATQPGNGSAPVVAGESPEKVTVRQVTIAPRRTVEFALGEMVSQRGLLQSVFVSSDKRPGEVLAKAVSRSGSDLYEVELLEKDQMDENNGGIHPWAVEGDSESHLLLFNYGKTPQVFGVGISNGSILWDKKYTLSSNETREISINELIQDKILDDKGSVLGPAHQRGVINWMVPDSGNATGRLMITSRSKAMARNFSCGSFVVDCGVNFQIYDSGFIPVNSTGDLWAALPEYCSAWGPGQCSGGNPVSSGSATYNWNIGAASIIKASSSGQLTLQSPQVTGVAPGGGSGSVEAEAGGCQSGGSGGGNAGTASIKDADIDSDTVTVVLSAGSGATGPLSVTATGTGATYTYSYNGGASVGPGTYSVALPRPSIPAGTYTSLKATWNPGQPATGTYTLTDKWIVLGRIRHSQYNTVYESTCPTATSLTYLVSSSCTWTTANLSTQFVSQTELNGSGVSLNHGPVKYDLATCGNRPAGSSSSNTLYLETSITGQCPGVTLVGGDSEATNPGPNTLGSKFNCGDDTTLVDGSNVAQYHRHIEDQCANTAQGCADGHIDDYNSSKACTGNSVGDLPLSPLWTVDY